MPGLVHNVSTLLTEPDKRYLDSLAENLGGSRASAMRSLIRTAAKQDIALRTSEQPPNGNPDLEKG